MEKEKDVDENYLRIKNSLNNPEKRFDSGRAVFVDAASLREFVRHYEQMESMDRSFYNKTVAPHSQKVYEALNEMAKSGEGTLAIEMAVIESLRKIKGDLQKERLSKIMDGRH